MTEIRQAVAGSGELRGGSEKFGGKKHAANFAPTHRLNSLDATLLRMDTHYGQ